MDGVLHLKQGESLVFLLIHIVIVQRPYFIGWFSSISLTHDYDEGCKDDSGETDDLGLVEAEAFEVQELCEALEDWDEHQDSKHLGEGLLVQGEPNEEEA